MAVDGLHEELNPLDTPNETMGFARHFGYLFNSWVSIAHCVECVSIGFLGVVDPVAAGNEVEPLYSPNITSLYVSPGAEPGVANRAPKKATHMYSTPGLVFRLDWRWVGVLLACVVVLLAIGAISVALESVLVAPDTLGYVSTIARNSRYLHLPRTATGAMSGSERARKLGSVNVMMQDVKANAEVGKIALGLKHEKAQKLRPGRLYR